MYCPQGVKIVLVGNKVDMEDARAVTTSEGQQFADEGKYAFFETSAKLNIRVEEAFRELVTRIVQSDNSKRVEDVPSASPASRVQITKEANSTEKKGCC